MELLALLLLIIAVAYGYYLQGQSSAKKDIANKTVETLSKAAKEAKKNEKEVRNLSDDELRKRLSK